MSDCTRGKAGVYSGKRYRVCRKQTACTVNDVVADRSPVLSPCLSSPCVTGQQQAGDRGSPVPGLDAAGAPVHGVAARPAQGGCRRDRQTPGKV